MEKSNSNGSPKRWLDNRGKGKLLPDGGVKKSIKKAQKKFDQMQRDMMQEAIYEKLYKPKATPPKGLNYFIWQGSEDQLEALWQALMRDGYIHSDTTKEDFRAIFSDDLTQCKAVKWTASNRLLAYLFNQMNSGSNPLILSGQWQSIIGKNKLFKNKAGKYLTAQDLATALNAINDQLKGLNPKGSEKIDEILENLNTLRP